MVVVLYFVNKFCDQLYNEAIRKMLRSQLVLHYWC